MCIDVNNLISQIITPIVGVLIGAGVSIYATRETIKSQFKLYERKEAEEAQAITCAIIAELLAIKRLLEFEIAPKMSESKLSFDYNYSNISEYFSIFNANLNNIGKISDKVLQKYVVDVYVKMKYFIDCLKTNNETFGIEAVEFKRDYLEPTYNEILYLLNKIEQYKNYGENKDF